MSETTAKFNDSTIKLSTVLGAADIEAQRQSGNRQEACTQALRNFLAQGYQLSSEPDDIGWTDAMRVASSCGIEGLRVFIKQGGVFNHNAQTYFGHETELMFIAKHAGQEGLELFLKNGGKPNPSAQDYQGRTEAELIQKEEAGQKLLEVYARALSEANKPVEVPRGVEATVSS